MSITMSQVNNDGYKVDTLGGSLNAGREFLRHFYGSIGVGYVDNKSVYSDSYLQSVSTLSNFYNDQYKKASGFASLKFDNTDDFYLPREGFIAAGNAEFAQMDGDLTPERILVQIEDIEVPLIALLK